MRPFASRFVAFVLLAVVFTVSTGMGFIEHTCLMKDEKAMVLAHKKSCCKPRTASGCTAGAEPVIAKTPCCEDRNVYVHVDFEGLSQQVQHFFSTVTALVFRSFWAFAPHAACDDKALHYSDTSPPACGRDTLAKKSTLQI